MEDRYKEMWEALKVWRDEWNNRGMVVTFDDIVKKMDRIEAEMGKE